MKHDAEQFEMNEAQIIRTYPANFPFAAGWLKVP